MGIKFFLPHSSKMSLYGLGHVCRFLGISVAALTILTSCDKTPHTDEDLKVLASDLDTQLCNMDMSKYVSDEDQMSATDSIGNIRQRQYAKSTAPWNDENLDYATRKTIESRYLAIKSLDKLSAYEPNAADKYYNEYAFETTAGSDFDRLVEQLLFWRDAQRQWYQRVSPRGYNLTDSDHLRGCVIYEVGGAIRAQAQSGLLKKLKEGQISLEDPASLTIIGDPTDLYYYIPLSGRDEFLEEIIGMHVQSGVASVPIANAISIARRRGGLAFHNEPDMAEAFLAYRLFEIQARMKTITQTGYLSDSELIDEFIRLSVQIELFTKVPYASEDQFMNKNEAAKAQAGADQILSEFLRYSSKEFRRKLENTDQWPYDSSITWQILPILIPSEDIELQKLAIDLINATENEDLLTSRYEELLNIAASEN